MRWRERGSTFWVGLKCSLKGDSVTEWTHGKLKKKKKKVEVWRLESCTELTPSFRTKLCLSNLSGHNRCEGCWRRCCHQKLPITFIKDVPWSSPVHSSCVFTSSHWISSLSWDFLKLFTRSAETPQDIFEAFARWVWGPNSHVGHCFDHRLSFTLILICFFFSSPQLIISHPLSFNPSVCCVDSPQSTAGDGSCWRFGQRWQIWVPFSLPLVKSAMTPE